MCRLNIIIIIIIIKDDDDDEKKLITKKKNWGQEKIGKKFLEFFSPMFFLFLIIIYIAESDSRIQEKKMNL